MRDFITPPQTRGLIPLQPHTADRSAVHSPPRGTVAGGPRGNQPSPRLTGPRTAPTSGWPGASVELSSTWGSAPLLLLACSLRVLRRLLRLHPAPWQRERCPMATRRQPALQATNLRVKEVMAGGRGGGEGGRHTSTAISLFFQYLL